MKKTLLSLFMLTTVGVFTTDAQITIYDTDIVGMGDNVEVANDSTPSVTIGAAGANQNWNFSGLNDHGSDTMRFRDPTTFPSSSNFPSANLGMTDTGEDSTWMFLNKSSVGLFVVGTHQIQNGQPIDLPITSTIITFPSTMGTNFGGTWNGILFTFPLGQDPDGPGPHGTVDSLRISRESTTNSNIDGWGNVSTPFGTFASLRQNIVVEDADTTWQYVNGQWEVMSTTTQLFLQAFGFNQPIFTYDTTRTARWWTNNPAAKFPIVEMDYEANGTVNSVKWQKASPTTAIVENNLASTRVVLFPNPAKNQITISTEITNGTFEILDLTGKLVTSFKINSNLFTINLNKLNNSIYFYNVKDKSGTTIYSNKFVVAK